MEEMLKLTTDNFKKALKELALSDLQKKMLRIHYFKKNEIITARELATKMGWKNLGNANMHYGRLGRIIKEEIGFENPENEHLFTILTFDKRAGGWHWILRKEFVQALVELGVVDPKIDVEFDDDLENTNMPEGAKLKITVNRYERNKKAREECLNFFGTSCFACNFDFRKNYGEIAAYFIHVHHLTPLSEIGEKYIVDPQKDMVPLCPNCHAVVHLKSPPFTIEELKLMIREVGKS